MTESRTRPRWARILLAAVRLAAMYAAGVLILVLPVILRAGDFEPDRQAWFGLSVIGAICFVLGFVALAVARRLGFALLWGLLVWWWMVLIGRGGPMPLWNEPFLGWTAFAAPLYVLSAIGLSTETTGSRRSQIEVVVTLSLWAIVAVSAFFPLPAETLRISDTPFQTQFSRNLRGYVYGVWPFLIGGRELGRVVLTLWRSRKGEGAGGSQTPKAA